MNRLSLREHSRTNAQHYFDLTRSGTDSGILRTSLLRAILRIYTKHAAGTADPKFTKDS
jgi:hypothetical protein